MRCLVRVGLMSFSWAIGSDAPVGLRGTAPPGTYSPARIQRTGRKTSEGFVSCLTYQSSPRLFLAED